MWHSLGLINPGQPSILCLKCYKWQKNNNLIRPCVKPDMAWQLRHALGPSAARHPLTAGFWLIESFLCKMVRVVA
jgi:hypothetical protein